MSYVRKGDESDVYVFKSIYGGFECCACDLRDGWSHCVKNQQEMIDHLRDHRNAGHRVPERTLERLGREAALLERSTGADDA